MTVSSRQHRPRQRNSTCSRTSERRIASLRARLGFDGKLLGAVTRIFIDSVLGWYRRRLRTSQGERALSGAVVAVQRASSDLKLNPHLPAVFLDGVYGPTSDGSLEFRALPRLSTTDAGYSVMANVWWDPIAQILPTK